MPRRSMAMFAGNPGIELRDDLFRPDNDGKVSVQLRVHEPRHQLTIPAPACASAASRTRQRQAGVLGYGK
ncbi:hypothetical protein ACXX9E_29545 [Pseudomonas sp. GNP014]